LSRSKGFALVLVLWVLSLLTIMAGSFALSMRREAGIVAGSSTNAQAAAIAESGLAIAELMLMHPDQLQRWRTDGSIYQVDYVGSRVRIRPLSEAGKIDINSADQALLQQLMVQAPMEAEAQTKLVSAILDWRDADDLVHIGGAEKEEYRDAGLSYSPRNKPFQSIEELQMVLGMNEQVFKSIENLVTVYSGQAKIDLTQASKEVLQTLPGVDAGLIDEYIATRRESAINGLPAPPFTAYSPIQPGPGAANQGIAPGQANPTGTAANGGTAQQGAITVVSEAQLDDGSTAVVQALIKKSDNALGASPFQVLKWQHNAVDGSLFADNEDELLVRLYAEPEFNN